MGQGTEDMGGRASDGGGMAGETQMAVARTTDAVFEIRNPAASGSPWLAISTLPAPGLPFPFSNLKNWASRELSTAVASASSTLP